ncbi:MAG TPA: beta-ketoacyl synthase chain length factor, partial [Pseudomonas sp.]|nr:beta-ketoacyl synthase chain length factor [Pseudomonas sp.]
MTHFNIDSWRAWAPGLDSTDDWQAWQQAPVRLADDGQQPDVSFLPALQRRRLSRLARMAFHVAWPLAEGRGSLPLVFVSRHGETSRNLAILDDLARDEALSPTQFSLSVHNAIIGLWSILRGDTSEMTALAAAGDGLEQALLEAGTLLGEGAPAVLLIVAEESPPEL